MKHFSFKSVCVLQVINGGCNKHWPIVVITVAKNFGLKTLYHILLSMKYLASYVATEYKAIYAYIHM